MMNLAAEHAVYHRRVIQTCCEGARWECLVERDTTLHSATLPSCPIRRWIRIGQLQIELRSLHFHSIFLVSFSTEFFSTLFLGRLYHFQGRAIKKFHHAIFSPSSPTPSVSSPSQPQSLIRPSTFDMVKNSNKRAERRAPEPGLELDYEPSSSTASTTAQPYKPFQHSQQPQPQPKKRSAGASMSKAARAKKAKAIERADKTNQKFVVNKAKAEKKKLMKS